MMNIFITEITLKLNPESFKNCKIQTSKKQYSQLEEAIIITLQEVTVLHISNLQPEHHLMALALVSHIINYRYSHRKKKRAAFPNTSHHFLSNYS